MYLGTQSSLLKRWKEAHAEQIDDQPATRHCLDSHSSLHPAHISPGRLQGVRAAKNLGSYLTWRFSLQQRYLKENEILREILTIKEAQIH